jgi:hypothetical protein
VEIWKMELGGINYCGNWRLQIYEGITPKKDRKSVV